MTFYMFERKEPTDRSHSEWMKYTVQVNTDNINKARAYAIKEISPLLKGDTTYTLVSAPHFDVMERGFKFRGHLYFSKNMVVWESDVAEGMYRVNPVNGALLNRVHYDYSNRVWKAESKMESARSKSVFAKRRK